MQILPKKLCGSLDRNKEIQVNYEVHGIWESPCIYYREVRGSVANPADGEKEMPSDIGFLGNSECRLLSPMR